MNQDVIRAIGYLNLVKAEYSKNLYEGEIRALNETLIALQRLAKER